MSRQRAESARSAAAPAGAAVDDSAAVAAADSTAAHTGARAGGSRADSEAAPASVLAPGREGVLHASALAADLVAWYTGHKRTLPWRGGADPYAVWVSEVMLQQTRVSTAIPYFEHWMERFPDLPALAAASLDAVLEAWQGLGYYARARNLHAAAREVRARHGSVMPHSYASLRGLPGFGPYTAGAVASIAFGERVPAVDGNARRVLARVLALDADPARPPGAAVVVDLARRMVASTALAPGDVNQGLMELGARVCVPRRPACPACPIIRYCGARRLGREAELPVRTARAAPREAHAYAIVLVRAMDGALLVGRRPPRGLLGGLWTFPLLEADGSADPLEVFDGAFGAGRLEIAPGTLALLPPVTHTFTHIRLTARPVVVTLPRVGRALTASSLPTRHHDAWRWVLPSELDGLPLSALMRKLIAAFRRRESAPV